MTVIEFPGRAGTLRERVKRFADEARGLEAEWKAAKEEWKAAKEEWKAEMPERVRVMGVMLDLEHAGNMMLTWASGELRPGGARMLRRALDRLEAINPIMPPDHPPMAAFVLKLNRLSREMQPIGRAVAREPSLRLMRGEAIA